MAQVRNRLLQMEGLLCVRQLESEPGKTGKKGKKNRKAKTNPAFTFRHMCSKETVRIHSIVQFFRG